MLVIVVGSESLVDYAAWWLCILAVGLVFYIVILSMNLWLYVWLCGGRKDGSRSIVSIQLEVYLDDVVNFPRYKI